MVQQHLTFKSIVRWLLLKFIAVHIFSSNFNMCRFLGRWISAYQFCHFKRCNFISVLQTQFGETAIVVESYSMAGSYCYWLQLPKSFLQNKLNVNHYKQNVDTNMNNFAVFIKRVNMYSKTSIINDLISR